MNLQNLPASTTDVRWRLGTCETSNRLRVLRHSASSTSKFYKKYKPFRRTHDEESPTMVRRRTHTWLNEVVRRWMEKTMIAHGTTVKTAERGNGDSLNGYPNFTAKTVYRDKGKSPKSRTARTNMSRTAWRREHMAKAAKTVHTRLRKADWPKSCVEGPFREYGDYSQPLNTRGGGGQRKSKEARYTPPPSVPWSGDCAHKYDC